MTLAHCLVLTLFAVAGLQEASDLETLTKRYGDAEGAQIKAELLVMIEELHTGPTSDPAILGAVGKAVEDEDVSVRHKAVTILSNHVEADVAIDGLVHAASLVQRQQRDEFERIQKTSKRLLKRSAAKAKSKNADPYQYSRTLVERVTVQTEAVEAYRAYYRALIKGLVKRRDDRCVDGLGYIAPHTLHGASAWTIMDALFAIGTRPAVAVAVEFIELDAKYLEKQAKERRALARQKPRKKPHTWLGSTVAWTATEEQRLAASLSAFDLGVAATRPWRDKCELRLRKFASETSLPSPPSDSRWKSWYPWWRKVRPTLPESLEG